MTFLCVGQALSLPNWETMIIKPVLADIYPDDCSLCCTFHGLFLLIRGPDRAHATVRDDEENDAGSLASVVMPRGSDAIRCHVSALENLQSGSFDQAQMRKPAKVTSRAGQRRVHDALIKFGEHHREDQTCKQAAQVW